jgi:hypothetical protein
MKTKNDEIGLYDWFRKMRFGRLLRGLCDWFSLVPDYLVALVI